MSEPLFEVDESGEGLTRAAEASSGSCSSRPTVAPGASSAIPLDGSSRPARIRSSVDLPAPFGPMMQ